MEAGEKQAQPLADPGALACSPIPHTPLSQQRGAGSAGTPKASCNSTSKQHAGGGGAFLYVQVPTGALAGEGGPVQGGEGWTGVWEGVMSRVSELGMAHSSPDPFPGPGHLPGSTWTCTSNISGGGPNCPIVAAGASLPWHKRRPAKFPMGMESGLGC